MSILTKTLDFLHISRAVRLHSGYKSEKIRPAWRNISWYDLMTAYDEDELVEFVDSKGDTKKNWDAYSNRNTFLIDYIPNKFLAVLERNIAIVTLVVSSFAIALGSIFAVIAILVALIGGWTIPVVIIILLALIGTIVSMIDD